MTFATSRDAETIIDLGALHRQGVIVAVTNIEVGEIEAPIAIMGGEVDQGHLLAGLLDIEAQVPEHERLIRKLHCPSLGETLEMCQMFS